MLPPTYLVILTALGFAGWPLIAKYSSATPTWVTISIVVWTALFTTLWYGRNIQSEMPSWSTLAILAVAALLNTAGMIAYGELIGGKGFDVSTYVPASLILTVTIATAGGIVFLGEELRWQKVVGLILGILTVYLLTQSDENPTDNNASPASELEAHT